MKTMKDFLKYQLECHKSNFKPLIEKIKQSNDFKEIDGLALEIECFMFCFDDYGEYTNAKELFKDFLLEKAKELTDPIEKCTDFLEMKKLRGIIQRLKFSFQTFTLKSALSIQFEIAKKNNAKMIISKIENSTNPDDIINLYNIVSLYIDDYDLNFFDIENRYYICREYGRSFFGTELSPEVEEIKKKLNLCLSKKTDLFMTALDKLFMDSYSENNSFYGSDYLFLSLSSMESILDDNVKTILYDAILKIINGFIKQINESSDLQIVEHLYTEIIYFAEYLPDDIWEEIDFRIQQILQDKGMLYDADDDINLTDIQKILFLR